MREWSWVFLAAIFLGVGYFLPQTSWFDSSQQLETIEQNCDLKQQDCEIQWSGQTFILSIEPRNITALQPMNIRFQSPEPNVGDVSIEFEGLNMDMGYNRVVLKPDGGGNYSAVAILPACTLETMEWMFHLIVGKNGEKTDFQFRVETTRQ